MLLAVKAAEFTYADRDDLRLEVDEAARSMARRLGDRATLVRVLNQTFHTSWTLESSAQRLADTAEAEKLVGNLHNLVASFWSALWRSFMTLEFADPDETNVQMKRVRALAAEVGQPTLRWLSLLPNAMWSTIKGDLEQAERLATEALELSNDTGQPDAVPIYGAQLISLRWCQGRMEEILETVAEVAHANPRIPAFRGDHALCLLETDRRADALARLESVRVRAPQRPPVRGAPHALVRSRCTAPPSRRGTCAAASGGPPLVAD